MVIAKIWTVKKAFDGMPKESDFEYEEEQLSEDLQDGELLCEALFFSVDPCLRIDVIPKPIGSPAFGELISKVIKSKNEKYPVGSLVRGHFGWRSHFRIQNPFYQKPGTIPVTNGLTKMPEMGELPSSLALGVMGRPGMAAYFGFLRICKPQKGETVVVSGAAGAVGSLVGQIAKIKGCKVMGFAGTDDKCKWLKEELGFDEAFNYKKVDLNQSLNQAAPEGIDCYFDNIGGVISSIVLSHMKPLGRVSLCGVMSAYNDKNFPPKTSPDAHILDNQLQVESFMGSKWFDEWPKVEQEIVGWIQEGKLKYRETVYRGFEYLPKAFIGLFTGANTGKAIVSISN